MHTTTCAAQSGRERIVVPRPVVTVVVIGVLLFVGADIIGQFIIVGHTANPLIDGPLIALLGSILIGSKGPKPAPPERAEPETGGSGRHRGEGTP